MITRKLRAELLRVLTDMQRTQAFIASDTIAICRIDDNATTTLHHTRAYVPAVDRSERDAKPLYRIAKDIGSDLCRLPDAIRALKSILESP